MATDAWLQARAAAVAWWRSVKPGQVAEVENELEQAHTLLSAARERGDTQMEQVLVQAWCLRLHQLLADAPDLMPGLRRLLDEHLHPAAAPAETPGTASMTVRAEARDSARVYVAGRDQHINGP
ncbi:hypothetical protein G5C60_06570 [Streptomyces sp. HC44]|uniref:Uncharacterized protein n=2 Tax=Streptomyces scabichelini TaxID=2711217 RepID=A0A6G4UZZ9_9ACTN|nr:hypothetical protein [Streptomyces scabichelini]NGO07321.1 hypothetical protein [Streptomyces scabichelini]